MKAINSRTVALPTLRHFKISERRSPCRSPSRRHPRPPRMCAKREAKGNADSSHVLATGGMTIKSSGLFRRGICTPSWRTSAITGLVLPDSYSKIFRRRTLPVVGGLAVSSVKPFASPLVIRFFIAPTQLIWAMRTFSSSPAAFAPDAMLSTVPLTPHLRAVVSSPLRVAGGKFLIPPDLAPPDTGPGCQWLVAGFLYISRHQFRVIVDFNGSARLRIMRLAKGDDIPVGVRRIFHLDQRPRSEERR